MTETVPEGYKRDRKGNLVREKNIRPSDHLEDQTVRKIMEFAVALNQQIQRFYVHCLDDIGAFQQILAEKYNASAGGAKGNVKLESFDGCKRIDVQVQDRVTFGPELAVAKTLIDQCILSWTDGVSDNIRTLVDHAFRPDEAGRLSLSSILSLRRVEIADPAWRDAMRALTDSLRISGSKEYIRFYHRESPESRWSPITIALSAAAPVRSPASQSSAGGVSHEAGDGEA